MKEFISKVGDKIRQMPKYEVGRSKRIRFQDYVVEYLGLKDLGKLKDRLEGQYFLDNSWKKICALEAVNEYLDLPEVDFKGLNLKDFQPSILIGEYQYTIICSEFGEFPILINENKSAYIVVYQKNELDYIIHGVITPKELEIPGVVEVSGLGTKVLKGIDKITMINEI